jgi:hypothetical protein
MSCYRTVSTVEAFESSGKQRPRPSAGFFRRSSFIAPFVCAAFRANCRSDGHNFLSQADSKRANQGPTLSASAAAAFCTDTYTGTPVMPGGNVRHSNSFQEGALLEAIAVNTVPPFRPKDRTNAERQRRYRAKRREAAVTVRERNGVTVDATPERKRRHNRHLGNALARRPPPGWSGNSRRPAVGRAIAVAPGA